MNYNITNYFRTDLIRILDNIAQHQNLTAFSQIKNLTVEVPRDPLHGELSTNAAMLIAKSCKTNPKIIAELVIQNLVQLSYIKEASIAGPGFINVVLHKSVWQNNLLKILKAELSYGDSNLGNQQPINIEFVSANPTGPMHIGHARSAVYGDALANLLSKCGYLVTREYYINDAGSQIEVLARSAYTRYLQSLGQTVTIADGLYPGDYLIPVGSDLANKYSNKLVSMNDVEWLPIVKEFTIKAMIELIKTDLSELGIVHDVFISEQNLHNQNKIEIAIQKLNDQGLLYQGCLVPPKGNNSKDWESREQLLFRSTDYGDDLDRPLQKSDGSWTYFAADTAYCLDKLERGFKEMILVLGADHFGYVKRMKAITTALSHNSANLDVKLCQLVNFIQNNQVVKMSKRAGNFETVRDVINEVGKDIIRFMMLTRKNDVIMDFDLQLVREQSKDNPVFYVQYANARAHSVLRLAETEAAKAYSCLNSPSPQALARLDSDTETNLLRLLAFWPQCVETSALHHEPHRLAFYLHQLAAEFHSFWNKGKEDKTFRVIMSDDTELTIARLAMVKAIANVIQSGFKIIGVTPINEM